MKQSTDGSDFKLVKESRIPVRQCLLLIPGVNVNAMVKGETLLPFAVRCRSVALVDALLELPETDVNEYGQQCTALHVAFNKLLQEIALKLINSDDLDGSCPVDEEPFALGRPEVRYGDRQRSRGSELVARIIERIRPAIRWSFACCLSIPKYRHGQVSIEAVQ
jgi:hypothetical protein